MGGVILFEKLGVLTAAGQIMLGLNKAWYRNYSGTIVPFNSGGGVKIKFGSYVGTGTHGSSNPNSLTFEFMPKLCIIMRSSGSRSSYSAISTADMLWIYGMTSTSYYLGSRVEGSITWSLSNSDKTLSWYSDDTSYQLNVTDIKYCYIGIG